MVDLRRSGYFLSGEEEAGADAGAADAAGAPADADEPLPVDLESVLDLESLLVVSLELSEVDLGLVLP
jgi:hypothetical protein